MSVLMNFAMFPTDKGTSVSKYVSRVIDMIRKSGFSYKLGSMSTTVETDTMAEALQILEKAYALLEPDSSRVYSTVTFDIKKSEKGRMTQKINSIEKHIGEVEK